MIKEKRVMALKGRCKQQKCALDAAKLDIQRLKKTIKTLEVSSFPYRHTDLAGYFLMIRVLPEVFYWLKVGYLLKCSTRCSEFFSVLESLEGFRLGNVCMHNADLM